MVMPYASSCVNDDVPPVNVGAVGICNVLTTSDSKITPLLPYTYQIFPRPFSD